jgi:hypothetical protein
MSAIRRYFDVDSMQRAVLSGLRARGVDAMTALEAGLTGGTDEEQLEFARSQGQVLFSFNVSHFYRLHSEYLSHGRAHAGIVLAPQQRYAVGERIRRLLGFIAAKAAEEMHNRLEFLSDWPDTTDG